MKFKQKINKYCYFVILLRSFLFILITTKDTKWKRTVILIETKVDALMQFDKGQFIKSIVLDLSVGDKD